MRRIEKHPVWIGHVGDLLDVRGVMAAGVSAVVELADNEPFANLPRDLIRLRFPLSDGGDNPPWLLRLAVDSLATLIREAVPTLVCCSCGLNRSVCLVAAGLARVQGACFAEKLAWLAALGPADVSPRLLCQMQSALRE